MDIRSRAAGCFAAPNGDSETGTGIHPLSLFRRHGATSFTDCLLRESACPVAEIARRCRFGDSAYFVRRFRERVGLPPERWRRCR